MSRPADVPSPGSRPVGSLLPGLVVHWNLAGWARHSGDLGVAGWFARWILTRSRLPFAVTVNEICSGQFELLAEALEPRRFSAAAAWSIPDFGRPRAASYGNAIFWRGGDGGVERHVYPDSLQVDGAGTVEKRVLLRVTAADVPLRVATTHPAPRREVAAGQVAAAAAWLGAGAVAGAGAGDRDPLGPTIFAGDLNLPPRHRALDGFYASHREAGRLPRCVARPTHSGFRKLDYLFVPRSGMRVVGGLSVRFRPSLSDHARIAAVVDLRRPADG